MSENNKPDDFTRDLLTNAGPIFDNPFLMKIVEAAPSPKAADNHMKNIGWDNGMAKRVRDAVRFIELYPKDWKQMVKTADKKSVFESLALDDDLNELKKFNAITVSAIRFVGKDILLNNLPDYLRHLSIKDEVDNMLVFDGAVDSIYDFSPPNIAHVHEANNSHTLSIEPNGVTSLMIMGHNNEYCLKISHFFAAIKVRGSIFPRLYKVVKISLPYRGFPTTDRWTFYINIDTPRKLVGMFKYERIYHVLRSTALWERCSIEVFLPFLFSKSDNGFTYKADNSVLNYKPIAFYHQLKSDNMGQDSTFFESTGLHLADNFKGAVQHLNNVRGWFAKQIGGKKNTLELLMPNLYYTNDFVNRQDMISFLLNSFNT